MSIKLKIEAVAGKISPWKKTILLLLTTVAGILILWPLLNFQYYISTGDHGRDLYCFAKTMEGALPYQHYSWLYGPLMPYYYSIFFSLGGISIQSVLLGQFLLILLAGIFVYLVCSVFLPPALSSICALWYWSFRGAEFFYTYNHIGGLLAMLMTLYCLLKYIDHQRPFHVWAGFISIFLLMLIRLNMGVAILIAFILSLSLTDFVKKNPQTSQNRRLFIYCSLAVIALSSLIYWFLLHPLPDYAISQSFPYGKYQRTDYTTTSFDSLMLAWNIIYSYFTATLAQVILGSLLMLSCLQCVLITFSKKTSEETRKKLILIFTTLFIFILATAHEFIASGTHFRIFWILPFIFITSFTLIFTATKNISSLLIKILILMTLFLPPLTNITSDHRSIKAFKQPQHLLHVGKNKVYTTQHPVWINTVTDAANFIREHVPPSDKVLTLPFDSLYLFLSERESITRQLVFFEHINITEEQEKKIISNMENDNGNWVIISSRAVSTEGGMGTFGKTYCLLLAKYIADHFTVVAEYGDLITPGGWAWNHGVRILKRKQ